MWKSTSLRTAAYFQLKKYLYGLEEAPYQFNVLLDNKLKSIGFKQSRADPCLFTRKNKRTGKRQYVATHVDDILVISPSVKERKQLERELEESFELSPQTGSKISYLGLNIVHDKDKTFIKISQEGMIKDLVKKYNMEKLKKYPTNPTSSSTFLTIKKKDNPKLPDNKEYLSIIMSLMFIARYTRPDILMPVSYLATKSNGPTEDDMDKAKRILKFLAGTTTTGIVFHKPSSNKLEPKFYADASHILYIDGYGQAGIIITFGSGPVFCRSFKLKMITRSSSES
jgi:hypothetical protein